MARRYPTYAEARAMSPAAWAALYWGEERPSVRTVAERLGITAATVRKLLRAAGVALRSKSEQYRADVAAGRIQAGANPAGNPQNLIVGLRTGVRLNQKTRAKITGRPQERIAFTCDWCGAPGEKTPTRYHRSQHHFCNRACGGAYSSWRRLTPDAPRPLISARIVAALSGPSPAARVITYESAERAGEPWGAGEAEIFDALEKLNA